ncbi:MAG: hybrid sensor histidine kinase/response regulator [Deltaproteobacteria bacterium]|nr:hybrid sensor histidine kinase/response regulator [Deltaproteobacteria bacterium]
MSGNDTRQVLYVDGAPEARAAFADAFGSRFSVQTAERGASALASVSARAPAVVISAGRLPDQDGAELLALVRERAPETARLMVGPADAPLVLDALNRAAVSRYIVSPWRPDELAAALEEGLALSARARHGRVLQLGFLDARRENGLGEAAASYAHDMCSPLSALATNLERLEQHVPAVHNLAGQAGRAGVTLDAAQRDATQELADITRESQESVAALTTLVEGLRARARPPAGGSADPAEALDYVVPLIRAVLGERGAELHVERAASPRIAVSSAELSGLLAQLLADAAAALTPELARRRVSLALRAERDGVRITVGDTGAGLSAEDLRRVERTKITSTNPSPRPGLAPVRERAIRAGGSFQLESAVGQGTTVHVWLPCADASEAEPG